MPHDHAMHGKDHKLERLENPERVRELDAAGTLERLGLSEGETVCDIGAGSGLFALAAAGMTDEMVYALDTDAEMIAEIEKKAQAAGRRNLKAITVDASGYRFDLPEASIDLVLIVSLLHEIEDKPRFLDEVKRILKSDGRLAVIEFHDRETPFGPPAGLRLSPEAVEAMLLDAGLDPTERFDLGDNFYCIAFSIQSS